MNYEEDNEAWPEDQAYTVRGYKGIAWRALGWETKPTEDAEWDGIEERTGNVVCIMIGDDCRFSFDPDDATPLEREAYCSVCGQIGCSHDGYERE